MSKRIKVLIAALVAVLLLTAIPATVVMAQEDESEPVPAPQTTVKDALLAKLAEILGISQDELAGAFEQARQELRDECPDCDGERARFGQGQAGQFKERFKEKWQLRREKATDEGRGRIRQELGEKMRERYQEWQQNREGWLESPEQSP